MNWLVDTPYLVFPVNTKAKQKRLTFERAGEPVYELDIKLDTVAPDFWAYIDVRRFLGETLTLSVCPAMPLSVRGASELDLPGLYEEPFRPQVHFTTKNGWINDPNGLVYADGVYHLFYQHNPAESAWSNMHWGHAVSRDLLHWEERPIALFPRKNGTIFSGSAVVDERNLLGKNTEDSQAVVLFYTDTAGYHQCMAYSCDGCQTVVDCPETPVVRHIAGENRDPKVVFCDELNAYVMALYLEGDEYCLLRSENLRDWQELQRVHLPGDSECPDLFPLTTDSGERRWVLMGAHDNYRIGDFRTGKFRSTAPIRSLHFGASAYAGQTYSNLPNGRVVRMVWDQWHIHTDRFAGQLGIPMEFTITTVDGEEYLTALPVRELQTLYRDNQSREKLRLRPEEAFSAPLSDSAYHIRLKGLSDSAARLNLTVFGRSMVFDVAHNRLLLGNASAPLSISGEFDVEVVIDRCSIEVFGDGGRLYLGSVTPDTVMDRSLPFMTLETDCECVVSMLEWHSLESIWR